MKTPSNKTCKKEHIEYTMTLIQQKKLKHKSIYCFITIFNSHKAQREKRKKHPDHELYIKYHIISYGDFSNMLINEVLFVTR